MHSHEPGKEQAQGEYEVLDWFHVSTPLRNSARQGAFFNRQKWSNHILVKNLRKP
jgi:hypothetical protein